MHSRMRLRKMSGPRGSRWRRVKVPTDSSAESGLCSVPPFVLAGAGDIGPGTLRLLFMPLLQTVLGSSHLLPFSACSFFRKGQENHKAHAEAGERERWSRRSQPARSGLAELISWVIYFIHSANIECLLCVRHCAGPRGRNRAGMERLAPSARLSSIRGRRWS